MESDKKRVLVAEDNAGLAHVMRFNLELLDLEVTVAMDGEQAWQFAQDEDFDLVVSDHEMPGLTGVQLCERIRQLPKYKTTPIIMVTARELELDGKYLRNQLLINEIFAKPYSPANVCQTVEQLLAVTSPTAG